MKITKDYLKQVIKEELNSLKKRVIKEVVEVVPGLPSVPQKIQSTIATYSIFLKSISFNKESGAWFVSFSFNKKYNFAGTKVALSGTCSVNIEEPSNPDFEITYINVPKKQEESINDLKNPESRFYKEIINKDVLNYIVIINNISSTGMQGKSRNAPYYLRSSKFEEWKSTKQ